MHVHFLAIGDWRDNETSEEYDQHVDSILNYFKPDLALLSLGNDIIGLFLEGNLEHSCTLKVLVHELPVLEKEGHFAAGTNNFESVG